MLLELLQGRLMAPFFGQSAYTWTAITAATLAGLSFGNTLGGWLSHRCCNGLKVSGAGLLLAGVWCLGMPWLSDWLGASLTAEVSLGWTARIGVYSSALLVPLMIFLGMVSPGVAYLFVRQSDTGRSVAILYFWGMIGSLVGSLVAGLWLPFVLPVIKIIFFGGVILLVLGGFVFLKSKNTFESKDNEKLTADPADIEGLQKISPRMYAAVFLIAVVCMGGEMAAIRLLTPVTGSSYVVWSVSFGIFIFGMAVGGWLGGRISDKYAKHDFLFYGLVTAVLMILATPVLIKLAAHAVWVSGWPWLAALFGTICISFIPLSLALGMLATMIFRVVLKDEESGRIQRRAIGWCYGIASAGNVVGTLIAGFWLVGIFRMSTILLSMALLLLACGMLLYSAKKQYALFLPLCFAVLCAIWGGKNFIDIRPLESQALGVSIFDEESRYGRVSVYKSLAQPTRRTMMLDRVEHSTIDTSDPQNLYSLYTRVLASVSDIRLTGQRSSNVCIIGGGGYALPRYFKSKGDPRVCVIELDPVVTKAAAETCALDVSAIESINLDGRLGVEDLLSQDENQNAFQVIIGDTVNDTAIPYHLVTQEFNEKAKRLLKEDGYYLLHVLDYPASGKLMASVLKTLGHTFKHQAVVAVTGLEDVRQSHVIVAANQPIPLEQIKQEILHRYPEFEGKFYGQADVDKWGAIEGSIAMSDEFAPVEKLILGSLLRATGYQVSRLLVKIQKALESKQYEQAGALVQRAFQKNPDNLEVIKVIYLLYEKTEDELFLELLKQSALRPSGAAVAKHYYAQALMSKGAYLEAAHIWDALAVRFVQLTEFLGYASRAYAEAGKLPEAYDRANRLAEGTSIGSAERSWAESLRRRMEAKEHTTSKQEGEK
jgi:spermidine synthase/MFS family permease